MENKPKIYGFCPAGCKWETVHFSDFEKMACCINQNANADGTFTLLLKKEYKVFAPKNTDGSFNATITLPYTENGVAKTHTIENAYADEYSDSFVFKLLDEKFNEEATELTLVYEIAGRRYTETISGTALVLSGDIIVSGATIVHLFNWDATLIGLKGEKGEDCTEELDKVKFFVGYREAEYVKKLETNFFTDGGGGTFYVGGNIDIWENADIENTTYLIKNDALGIRVIKKGSGEYFTHTFTPPASGEQTVSIGIYGAMAEGYYGLCITNIFADVQTLTFDGVFEVYEVIYQ